MARRKTEEPAEPQVLTTDDLDRFTARGMAEIHLNRIFVSGLEGEQELLMMLLHLLHARRHNLNVEDVNARRADFEEHFKQVMNDV